MKSEYDFEKKLIIEQLLDVPEDDMVEYSQLSALTGLDLQGDYRYLLDSALGFVLKQHGIAFRNIRNTGYKRLTPFQMVDDVRGQNRVLSATDKSVRILGSADWNRLDNQYRRRHNAKMAAMAIAALAVQEQNILRIESTIKDAKSTNIQARAALQSLLDDVEKA